MMTVDYIVLGRYLSGQASPEERAAVEAWLGADAERRTAVAALQAAWAADARQYEPSYDTDAAWRRLRRGLAQTARPARSVASRWRPPAIAAGLVVLVGVGGVWWLGAHPVARLRAGQVATLSRAGAVRVLQGADVTNELAWTRGRLVFTSVPLSEAAQRLGRWYDLDVLVIDSTLARRPITGSYSSEPVSEVLTLITSAVGARYEWSGRSVTISMVRAAR